jgi:hypothetical protein
MSASYIGSFLMGQQLTALQVALDAEKAKTATLQTWASDRVKYAYPNGGSEGDEKTLSLSGIYHLSSPFGVGVKFNAITEYFSLLKAEWVELQKSFYASSDSGGYGTLAYSRSQAGMLVVTTGTISLAYSGSPSYGGGWGQEGAENSKWRVRCIRED